MDLQQLHATKRRNLRQQRIKIIRERNLRRAIREDAGQHRGFSRIAKERDLSGPARNTKPPKQLRCAERSPRQRRRGDWAFFNRNYRMRSPPTVSRSSIRIERQPNPIPVRPRLTCQHGNLFRRAHAAPPQASRARSPACMQAAPRTSHADTGNRRMFQNICTPAQPALPQP